MERRGQAETDPMKKARIAGFLKEYWGVKNGLNQFDRVCQNGRPIKTTDDIAETLSESKRNTHRLLKLNDLIPELQQLVSDGKLGTTAAELFEEAEKAKLSALKKGDKLPDRCALSEREKERPTWK